MDRTSVDESSTTKPDDSDTDVTDGSTGAAIACGDGVLAGDEQCDTDDLAGEDCISLDQVAGCVCGLGGAPLR